MAVYAIGDIQGCLDPLRQLLDRLKFDPSHDQLWLTGDLVNRGPDSVGVLRLARELDGAAVTVLGNHDIHMLAVARGYARLKRTDSIKQVIEAPDADELLEWLRRQPLLYEASELNTIMTHAGIWPAWSLPQARRLAAEAEAALSGDQFDALMANLYGDEPNHWDESLTGWDRIRFIINAFTRMRFCAPNGDLLLDFKGAPADAPPGYIPWFRVPGRLRSDTRIVFGHWSTLGYVHEDEVVALDTGCLWGGALTAVRLDGPLDPISVDCPVTQSHRRH